MQYRILGRSGVNVSALCLGSMNFGDRTDQAESTRIIHAAIDAGINFIDTANAYPFTAKSGLCEQIVGEALSDGRRDKIVLATKVGARMGKGPNEQRNTSRYNIMRNVEASLRRLRTDYIDLYQIHVMDLNTAVDEVLRTLDDLVRAGKVRHIGVSKWAPALIAEAVMLADRYGWARPVSEQPPYNLLDRRIEDELIWTCQRHGLGLIPWAPIGGGILSGKYSAEAAPAAGSRFAHPNRRLTGQAIARADALKPLAEEKGVSLAEFSLAWVLNQPGIVSPIIGPSKMEHLESSLKALDVTLSPEDHERIDQIAPPGSAVSDFYECNVYVPLRWTAGIYRFSRLPHRGRRHHHGTDNAAHG